MAPRPTSRQTVRSGGSISARAVGTAMLEIDGLDAWYGASHVLHGLTFAVRQGEILALIGRNGAGKTTTMKAVMGLIPKVGGRVRFLGQDLLGRPAHGRFPLGLAYVPED